MTLCDLCTDITKWLAKLDSSDGSQYKSWIMRAKKQSPETMCSFCKVWLFRLQKNWQWHYLMLRRFYFRIDLWCFYPNPGCFPYDPGHPNHSHFFPGSRPPLPYPHSVRGRITEIEIPNEYWGKNWNGSQQVWLDVVTWTDSDDPNQDESYPLRELLSPRFTYICDTYRKWLKDCEARECRLLNRASRLPTRLLVIRPGASVFETPSVKLIESGDGIGRYCALSHCWGTSKDKMPACTTNENLEERMIDIPFFSLPTTFQDALLFARGVGIFYVWIDSLCIVQDDDDDWDKEARQMGNIYKNASLVLLASGAGDSTVGLFFREVPFVAEHKDSVFAFYRPFNASLRPNRYRLLPSDEPLYQRAWACQERYLAQHIIYFMRDGFAMQCARGQMDDLGEVNLGLYDEDSWHGILGSYSRKSLTFERDRLPALRGIVDDVRMKRKDDFYYQYGVWKTTLYQDLLWRRCAASKAESQTGLPTWTWAATSGGKIWCPDQRTKDPAFDSVSISLEITSRPSLAVTGYLTDPLPIVLSDSYGHFRLKRNSEPATEEDMMLDTDELPSELQPFTIWDSSVKEEVLGLANFDTGNTDDSARCLLLAVSHRTDEEKRIDMSVTGAPASRFYKSSDKVHSSYYCTVADVESFGVYGEDTPLTHYETEDWPRKFGREASRPISLSKFQVWKDDCFGDDEDASSDIEFPDYQQIERRCHRMKHVAAFVYWALLLKHTANGNFERIGLAMLYPHALSALNAELSDIEIV